MKKIFRVAFIALSMMFFACEDATDIIQESELNEDAAFNTVDDLERGLNGVYSAYGPDFGTNGDGDVLLFNDLFTDNIKRGVSSTGQGSTEASFILQPGSDFPIRIWGNRYATINFANRILNNLERLTPNFTDAELLRANRIKAELLAMRALAHFDLLQYFTVNYQDLNSPSIIIVDFVPEVTDALPRNTTGEVFTFVNNSLNEALSLLENSTVNTERGVQEYYMRPEAIVAVQARVALFQGDYARAEALVNDLSTTYAYKLSKDNEVINGVPTQTDRYSNMFRLDAVQNTEAIFVLQRILGNNTVGQLFAPNSSNRDGNPFYEMSNQLYDLYSPTDIRKTLFVDQTYPNDLIGSNRILVIDKYPGTANGLLLNSIKLIRFSEMLLIKAECQARQGNLAGAATSVNELKQARQDNVLVSSYADANQALSSIMDERRKELCFEGHRYLDIKRIGKDINRGVSRDPRDCGSFSAPCDLSPTDYRFTVPIPQTEISANPTIQQNPGY